MKQNSNKILTIKKFRTEKTKNTTILREKCYVYALKKIEMNCEKVLKEIKNQHVFFKYYTRIVYFNGSNIIMWYQTTVL